MSNHDNIVYIDTEDKFNKFMDDDDNKTKMPFVNMIAMHENSQHKWLKERLSTPLPIWFFPAINDFFIIHDAKLWGTKDAIQRTVNKMGLKRSVGMCS